MVCLIFISTILLFIYFAYELFKLKKEIIDSFNARIRKLELEVFSNEYSGIN